MSASVAATSDLRAPLRRLFGFADFLPGQEEVVSRALSGRDTLALMPTGSGKSLPYQLAAMLRPTPTLVLSPLIALMKDQVDKLPPPVARQASVINSSLGRTEAAARLAAFADGGVKLLYAAPERLRQHDFVAALAAARVGLVVVDEVHCVSMWGHDFRPDYLFIRRALSELGEPPVLGLTATATPATERDIASSLDRTFDVVRASVVRPNLHHVVEHVDAEEDRRRALLSRLERTDGPAIVYARSRKKCEELSRLLRGHRLPAAHYHAGLDPLERSRVQEAFVGGDLRIVVATTAFGMGIDKPDIRLVLLYNYPGSLEDYVQMVGRAGRDGGASACVLFAGRRDERDLTGFVSADAPPVEALRRVHRRLVAAAGERGIARIDPEELEAEHDPKVLVSMLERAGLARRGFDDGRAMQVQPLHTEGGEERLADLVTSYEHAALERVRQIVGYARSKRCRQEQIAAHFGERVSDSCGSCDSCTGGGRDEGPAPRADAEPRPLPDDIAGAILAAVAGLRWPLGKTGLAAMLAGSVSAPPSARGTSTFGILAAAPLATIKRWLGVLTDSGHLERYESDDGYPLLRRGAATTPPPRLTAPGTRAEDEAPLNDDAARLFDRLREWRLETARAAQLPAYVVLPDRTLRALARTRPLDQDALLAVPGVGRRKVEQYGAALLAITKETRAATH